MQPKLGRLCFIGGVWGGQVERKRANSGAGREYTASSPCANQETGKNTLELLSFVSTIVGRHGKSFERTK